MTLTHKTNNTIVIGEWFDIVNGNTYYDATICIGDKTYTIPYQYGYDASNWWNINELLNQVGIRIRKNQHIKNYVTVYTKQKKKRELIK